MKPRLGHVAGGWDRWVIYDADAAPGYASAHITGNWIESHYDGPGGMEWAEHACRRHGLLADAEFLLRTLRSIRIR